MRKIPKYLLAIIVVVVFVITALLGNSIFGRGPLGSNRRAGRGIGHQYPKRRGVSPAVPLWEKIIAILIIPLMSLTAWGLKRAWVPGGRVTGEAGRNKRILT